MTLNTDNMSISNIDLDFEYDIARNILGFSYNDLIQMNIYSIEGSFMPEEEKPAYIARLKEFLR